MVLKIDWCSSKEISFDLSGDQTKEFLVKGFKIVGCLLLGIVLLHLLIKYIFGFGDTIYLVIPLLLLIAYYLTFDRKRYLTLKEIS
jgi:hypothetical protein